MLTNEEHTINITADNIRDIEALFLHRTNLVFEGLYIPDDNSLQFSDIETIHGGYTSQYTLFVSLDEQITFNLYHTIISPENSEGRVIVRMGHDLNEVFDAIVADYSEASRFLEENII